MFRHAVCNILVYVIAMGTADVQAVCDVLKREEEEEKILIDKLKELLVENEVSEQSYTKVFFIPQPVVEKYTLLTINRNFMDRNHYSMKNLLLLVQCIYDICNFYI